MFDTCDLKFIVIDLHNIIQLLMYYTFELRRLLKNGHY